jgi:hypothetical protein
MGKVKLLDYDGNCTSRDFRFGTYKILSRWIFVEQRVPDDGGSVCLKRRCRCATLHGITIGKTANMTTL